jgi:hypothetical protein
MSVPNDENLRYLLTKREKMGHLLHFDHDDEVALPANEPAPEPGQGAR